jgi:hypothetical protein
VIDHHPLLAPESGRPNLRLLSVSQAFHCCLGDPQDELMVVAAICEREESTVLPRSSALFRKRAVGLRRACADVSGVSGAILLRLLRERRWDFLEALADEPSHLHRSVRGRRVAGLPRSPLLESAKSYRPAKPSKSPLGR